MISEKIMDVLRPQIIRIGGRCYRKNATHEENEDFAEQGYSEANIEYDEYADEVCDSGLLAIEETDTGYRFAMNLPSVYFKFIIGKKGETKKKLENDTRTQILIPKLGQVGDVVILGHDRSGIVSAKSRLDILIESARQKQPFTHFLSLPVVGKVIESSFLQFKEDVLQMCSGDRGIDDSIFQNSKKLHLTLGTLVLLSDSELQRAEDLLKECYNDIIHPALNGSSLPVTVTGLEYMNDDPAAVDVLYAQVQDPSDRLQPLVEELVDRFTREGLMQKDYDRVKLHITVMNTLFRKDPSGVCGNQSCQTQDGNFNKFSRSQQHVPRESFDATNVLRKFEDYTFCTYDVNTVHLSQRYSTGSDGYYAYLSKVDFS